MQGGAHPPTMKRQPFILQLFPMNLMKLKNIGSEVSHPRLNKTGL